MVRNISVTTAESASVGRSIDWPTDNSTIITLFILEWLDNFMTIRIERLHERCQQVCQKLDKLCIHYLKPEGGLYVLIDLRKVAFSCDYCFVIPSLYFQFLTENNVKGERELCNKLVNDGVCLVPATQMNCLEPGWFRLVFSRQKEEVEEGKNFQFFSQNLIAKMIYFRA